MGKKEKRELTTNIFGLTHAVLGNIFLNRSPCGIYFVITRYLRYIVSNPIGMKLRPCYHRSFSPLSLSITLRHSLASQVQSKNDSLT